MKLFALTVLFLSVFGFNLNAQTDMVVELNDGTVYKYDVEEVDDVTFLKKAPSFVSISGKNGLYDYVDLGLEDGLMWATFNVGASEPYQYGDYFAWAETNPKTGYDALNYKWYSCDVENEEIVVLKYKTLTHNDPPMYLEPEDDAAVFNWGDSWRMPTQKEFETLVDGCTWEWVENFCNKGANGYLATSKTNGNTIFFPAAGHKFNNAFSSKNYVGHYWTSELNVNFDESFNAECFMISSFANWVLPNWSCGRPVGCSVRAVCKF